MSILADLVELMETAESYVNGMGRLAEDERNWEETDVDSKIKTVFSFDIGWELRNSVITQSVNHPFKSKILEKIQKGDEILLESSDFVSYKLDRHSCVKAIHKA